MEELPAPIVPDPRPEVTDPVGASGPQAAIDDTPDPADDPVHRGGGIVARDLQVTVPNGPTILQGVDLTIAPGEFCLVLGPSGAGKTTLLDALSGRRIPTEGSVRIAGHDPYGPGASRLPASAIGYVPQADIVHDKLPVERALRYAARLRLPDAPDDEIEDRVEGALERTGLLGCKGIRIEDLSGGQRRRVSLAAELVGDPPVLFIDEATSGLDAAAEAMLMELFRRLADGGTTVVCITHQTERAGLADRHVILHDGRLVAADEPDAITERFRVKHLGLVYGRLRERDAAAWALEHEAARAADPSTEARAAEASTPVELEGSGAGRRGPLLVLRQAWLIARRQVELLWNDPRTLGFLLLQAPIVALCVRVAFLWTDWSTEHSPMSAYRVVFLAVTAVIWFSLNNSVRQVAREGDIYRRERGVGLSTAAYLGGKASVLAILSVIQVVTFVAIVFSMPIHEGYVVSPVRQGVILSALALSGLGIGLAVSSLVRTPDRATAIAPFVLLPQIVFSGILVPIKDGLLGIVVPLLIPAYWAYRGGRASETDAFVQNVPDWTYPPEVASEGLRTKVHYMGRVLGEEAMPYVDGIRTEVLALFAFGVVSLLIAYFLLRRRDVSRRAESRSPMDGGPSMSEQGSRFVFRFDLGVILAVAIGLAAVVAWSDVDRRLEATRDSNARIEQQIDRLIQAQAASREELEAQLEEQRHDIRVVASEVSSLVGEAIREGRVDPDARVMAAASEIEQELRDTLSSQTEEARRLVDMELRELLRILLDRFEQDPVGRGGEDAPAREPGEETSDEDSPEDAGDEPSPDDG